MSYSMSDLLQLVVSEGASDLHLRVGIPPTIRVHGILHRVEGPSLVPEDTEELMRSITSEEHAQSEAIASCLNEFTEARVPIVATIIGEGGSGGALALGIADRVIMLENSVYSVASPEGCAAILWGDAAKAEEAAARLNLTAEDLERFGIVDEIVPEPLGGAHREPSAMVAKVLGTIRSSLQQLSVLSPEALREARYSKYRRLGAWQSERREPMYTGP